MSPAELRAWKERHGLTVAELAWIARRSRRTIERKLSGEIGRIMLLEGIVECYDLMIASGIRPPRWPPDLPPNPTEIRRRKRRRKFASAVPSHGFVDIPPKRQGSRQISAPIR